MRDAVSRHAATPRQGMLWRLAPEVGANGRALATGDAVEAQARPQFSADTNRLQPGDRTAHDWYRFVLSFPPHLVREYLQRFGVDDSQTVLDPFCGTGTTLVECKKMGIASIGIEANPMAHFASAVKVDWSPDPDELLTHTEKVAEAALAQLQADGIQDDPVFPADYDGRRPLRGLNPEQSSLLLKGSISPLPLHKTLVLLDALREHYDERYSRHELLALAKALVYSVSNLHFGPEVGVGPSKPDAPVVATWLDEIRRMANDLRSLRKVKGAEAVVHLADARAVSRVVAPETIDAVVTSPPYPNEKDYTRATRLESVLLGFIRSKSDLQKLKRTLVRSNTRGVYNGDDDDRWIASHAGIQRLAEEIEARRVRMGKTSGFERLYARVTRLYFGGMARHLADLRVVLRPGARLAYVVGDQASYLRVMIRTGTLLAEIAESLGYQVDGIDLFRTRLATATREPLREEVVILHWPGGTGRCL